MSKTSTLRPSSESLALVAVAAALIIAPQEAHAQVFDTGTNFLNALVDVMTATWARLIGIIAVVVTGIMWMTGRLNMGWALSVIGGLILVFGSTAIVDSVAGSV
ncbi:MAG: TrbC/VirB2 family protein [Pseudomonadota bacterium]